MPSKFNVDSRDSDLERPGGMKKKNRRSTGNSRVGLHQRKRPLSRYLSEYLEEWSALFPSLISRSVHLETALIEGEERLKNGWTGGQLQSIKEEERRARGGWRTAKKVGKEEQGWRRYREVGIKTDRSAQDAIRRMIDCPLIMQCGG